MLYGALCRHGNPPVGPFWSSFGGGDSAGTVELSLCWPVARPLPAGFAIDAATTRVGTFPARRELVARWTHPAAAADADTGQDEATHPAVVALLGEMEARGLGSRGLGSDLASLRQIAIMGDAGPIGVELALTVA